MELDFRNESLLELYEKGKSRKYRFVDIKLCKKFTERINRILASKNIYDLRNPPSNHFEKLKGYEKRFSLRLDDKHRLEFDIDFDDEERTIGKVWITELSKHYR